MTMAPSVSDWGIVLLLVSLPADVYNAMIYYIYDKINGYKCCLAPSQLGGLPPFN